MLGGTEQTLERFVNVRTATKPSIIRGLPFPIAGEAGFGGGSSRNVDAMVTSSDGITSGEFPDLRGTWRPSLLCPSCAVGEYFCVAPLFG